MVLASKDAGEQAGLTFSNNNLVAALFEAPPIGAPGFAVGDGDIGDARTGGDIQNPSSFPGLSITIEPITGRTTVILEQTAGLATVAQDPTLQDQVYLTAENPKVQRNGANYRLDVTDRVQKWVADWPNRLKARTHGFIFVGMNEINPPSASNVALWAHYAVTLEFKINAPDF